MEKNMHENFELLEKRVFETLKISDLKEIKEKLKSIEGPTICTGVGGSSVVAEYASKVLAAKNKIIAIAKEPRDLLYEDANLYKNVLACSYSGSNYGTEISFNNKLKKYLLSNNLSTDKDITNIQYLSNIPKEKSFISLASTLMPMAILTNYYLDGDYPDYIIYDIVGKWDYRDKVDKSEVYEIMSGKDTSCASKFLESALVESGICIPVVHDKYSFCHGRSTLSYVKDNTLIYFYRYTELDNLILNDAKNYYRNVITLDLNYSDSIMDDFNLTVKAMYLCKAIAEKKQKDLSGIDYSPMVKKLYKFNGKM